MGNSILYGQLIRQRAETYKTNQEKVRYKSRLELSNMQKIIENHHCKSDFGHELKKQIKKRATIFQTLSSKVCMKSLTISL